MVISLILAVVIVIIDQVTKFLLYGMSQSLIGDFLWLESTLNTGASFGMMQNSTVLFIIMTIPVILAIIYVICSKKYLNKFNKICLGIVLGGAVGNLIDRFFFGGVRDFIYFKSINFAIFNFADMAVTIGVIMFIVGLIVQIFKNKKQESVAASKPSDEKPENPERLEALKDLRDTLKDASQSYENSENDDDGGEAD